MIVKNLLDYNTELFINLQDFSNTKNLYLKIEGLNYSGSIKQSVAVYLIENAEKNGQLIPGKSKIIESSSGNFAVALSIVSKVKGYSFTAVVDPHISKECLKQIQLYGGTIHMVTEKDENGGYLNTRVNFIKKLLKEKPEYYWPNQYANNDNPELHYKKTAPEILRNFPKIAAVFIPISTCGTLVGVAKYFKEHSPFTKIIAVDSIGSVNFGFPPGERKIPGLGTSRIPEIISNDNVFEVIKVLESEMIIQCHKILSKMGLCVGGSTGAVLAAIIKYQKNTRPSDTIIGISPDLGNQYIDTMYNPDWVKSNFNINLW